MSVSTVIARLKMGGDGAGALRMYWRRSKADFAWKNALFLSDRSLSEASAHLSLANGLEEQVLACAARVRAVPDLSAFAWYCRWCFSRAVDGHAMEDVLDGLPAINDLVRSVGDFASVFYAMVLLSSFSVVVKRMALAYRRHRIGSRVARRTLRDVAVEFEDYRVEHGRWGMEPGLFNWFKLHFSGSLFRIGRFNFELGSYGQSAYAMRHRKTSLVLLVAKNGVTFDSSGQLVLPSDEHGVPKTHSGRWISRLAIAGNRMVGNPIWPEGHAERKTIVLRSQDWQRILSPGDPVLHLHVPSGGRLDFDPIGRNFQKALDFFRGHFPRYRVRAMDCVSWLLDRQLQVLLPSESNIVRFQREFYLLPSLSGNEDLVRAVFGTRGVGSRPYKTRLQRELGRRLGRGEPMNALGGGCVLFERDLDWGKAIYLNQDFESVGLRKGDTG